MSDNAHILIVDDETGICEVVREYLLGEGYRISVAHDGAGMRQVMGQGPVDLVLLDVVLPGEDGLMLARSLRGSDADLGIIMLTGRGDAIDRIVGLELGADDYIAKPFHLRELLARVKSVRRRATYPAGAPPTTRSKVRFADWLFDLQSRELLSGSGENVRLTGGEFDLLAAFVGHPNQVLSRDHLLDLICGREGGPFDRTIDVQVGRLRRKLNDDPRQPQLIKTVRGGGYMFAASLQPAPGRAAGGIEAASLN